MAHVHEPECVGYACRRKYDAEFVMAFTCQSEFDDGKPCDKEYDVPCYIDDCGKWVADGKIECPACGGEDNPFTVVCAHCREEAPQYCRDCGYFGCCCPDPDDLWEQRRERLLERDHD